MKTSFRSAWRRSFAALGLSLAAASPAAAQGVLSIDVVVGHNLVVDSNVTAPSTYAPSAAYIAANYCNTGNANLTNVVAYVGNYDAGRSFSVTTTAGSATVTTSGNFQPANDGGLLIIDPLGTRIPVGTWLEAVANTNSATLSQAATASGTFTATLASAPGIFPVKTFGTVLTGPTHLNNTGPYSYTLEVGSGSLEDATRYIGTLTPGQCRIQYWLFSYPQCVNVNGAQQYPPCDVSIAGGVKPDDDLDLDYDVWGTADSISPALVTRDFTMRNEISAAANKIWPNTASKVPDEYLSAIQGVVGWGTLGPDGQPLTDISAVYPGQRVITTQGIWYDLGNVVHGFDNDGDLIVDQNAWLQPVGDPGSFDSSCFRMVNVYGIVIVKLKSGGELLIPFQNQLYHENLPDNTGVVGLVYYQYIATREGCSSNLTPYQEAASGYDNEKFAGDYGLNLGLQSGEFDTDLTFSKTDGVSSIAPGGTLTYTVSATNSTGVPLGAPDIGTPLIFRETIPSGTTYVANSADDVPNTNLVEPAGTGTYSQGYTDRDGNLDTCTINYNITSSAWIPFYSTDGGFTWSLSDPGTSVTDLRWMLQTTIALDGGHDRDDCIAPDTVYDNGPLETSLPPGKTVSVTFQVTVDTNSDPVICNTARFGFGPAQSNVTAQDCTLVTGPNSIAGTVFEDDGGTGGTYGNGTIDNATEVGIGSGSIVRLYYDANQDGQLDTGDLYWGQTTTSATGTYSFSGLPDGNYLVVAKKYDGVRVTTVNGSDTVTTASPVFSPDDVGKTITGTGIPGGTTIIEYVSPTEVVISADATASGTVMALVGDTADAATDFLAARAANANTTQGWGNTTYDPNLPLTTDSGILKLGENLTTVTLAISIDLDHSNGANQSLTTTELTQINFGFAPPFELTKTVTATTVDEGDLFDYTIELENRLPSVGVQGPTGCQYTAWATTGTNGSPANKAFTDYLNGLDGPNRRVATAVIEGGANRFIDEMSGFRLAPQAGSITRVEVLVMAYYNLALDNDRLELSATLPSGTTSTTLLSAAIDSYIGPPATLSPNSAISWDITSTRPGGGTWAFTDFPILELYVNPAKASGADTRTFNLDAVGIRVTTNADCEAGTSTTLSPVPLQDRYDTTYLTYVSAVPPPDSVDLLTGTLQWNNVGPILPGTSNFVTVTMRASNVTGLQLGSCAGVTTSTPPGANSLCNLAQTAYGSNNVYYADGRLANDDDDMVAVNIQGKGELRGTVYRDTDNDGWPLETPPTDIGLPGVTVTLFACVQDDDVTLETGTSNSKDCSAMTTGNAWQVWATTLTDADGEYEFLGLDNGYYIIQVGDTDGVVTTAGSSPFGFTQTAEPNDSQATTGGANNPGGAALGADCGTCNNTWGSSAANLRSDQTTINRLNGAGEEIVSGINFGYFSSQALIYGNVWHDVDGDATRETGENGLDNFTVRLYTDPNGDGDPADGSLVQTTTSDDNGNYYFTTTPANPTDNDYVIVVTPEILPNNVWDETDEANGTDPGTEGALDNRIPITVDQGETSGSHDFGYTLDTTSAIGDRVWYDFDGDGVQDLGENGMPDVTVWLYSDVDRDGVIDVGVDELLATDVTDADGYYLFEGLSEGSYIVVVDTDDPDFPSGVTATADPDIWAGTIGDRVWYDFDGDGVQDGGETGIPGVVVLLWAADANPGFDDSQDTLIAATTTNVNGNYLFTGLPAGSYYVTVYEESLPDPALARTSPVAENSSLITLASSTSSVLTADFGYSPASGFAIGSRVWHDQDGDGVQDAGEVGLAGVDITVTGGACSPTACTTTTDAAGFWILTGLTNATYTIAVDDADLPRDFVATTGTTDPDSVTVAGADQVNGTDFDFGYRHTTPASTPTGTISGSVFLDVDGDDALDSGEAMASVTVNLLDADGYVIATTTTNGSGAYSFPGVFIGDYAVEVLASYGTQYSVLFLSSTAGFPNLNVIYDATSATTADDQSSVSVDGVNDNLLQDFGYQRFQGSIGDTVYWDANENGTQDIGEAGIANVDLSLFVCTWDPDTDDDGIFEEGEGTCDPTPLATTTTTADDPLTSADEGGKYLFSNLDDLTTTNRYYVVAVDTTSLPGTYGDPGGPGVTTYLTADPETDGLVCAELPDPDFTTPPEVCDNRNLVITFTGGLNYLGADFGYQITSLSNYGKIGDYVWVDTDGDGVRDAGEAGVPAITVWVDTDDDGVLDWTDGNGNGTWDSGEGERWTETDSDGYYLFSFLPDSTYRVRVMTSDTDWPAGLSTTPTYEVRLDNNDSLNSIAIATVSGGVVTQIEDGDGDTTDTCTDCDLDVDFGYRYTGTYSLSGTVCLEDDTGGNPTFGNCGDSATDYSGVTSGTESALSGVSVYLYLWTDDGDNTAWNGTTGVLDSGDTFTLIGSTSTDANGDYTFLNVPPNVVVAFGVSPTQTLQLNTTNANTSAETPTSRQLWNGTQEYGVVGDTSDDITTVVRQALNLAGNTSDVDFAFDSSLLALDFGDLPDSTYSGTTPDYDGTRLAAGARHLVTNSSVYLGSGVTPENDGFDSPFATGETDSTDDGVELISDLLYQGLNGGGLDVVSSGTGWLLGWIDFDGDGSFSSTERVADQQVVAGHNEILFDVPADQPLGSDVLYARFRLYDSEPLFKSPLGVALDATFQPIAGEVEDYMFSVSVTAAVVHAFVARDGAKGVTLEWETASEVGTLGFLLRRFDPAAGSFVAVDDRLIPATPGKRQGSYYRHPDPGAASGADLLYQLVEVESSGRQIMHGPYAVNTATASADAVSAARTSLLDRREADDGTARAGKALIATSPRSRGPALRGGPKGRTLRAKLAVSETGIHFVSLERLQALGLAVDKGWLQSHRNLYTLSVGGEPVAFSSTAAADGILFYAEAIDSPYTRENVYWLEPTTGLAPRMQRRRDPRPAAVNGDETFSRTVRLEQDLLQFDGLFDDPEADTFIWDLIGTGLPAPQYSFPANGARPRGTAQVRVRVRGASQSFGKPDHRIIAKINGRLVGESTFDGLADHEVRFEFDSALLADGDNVLELAAGATGAPWSYFMLDWFEVSYPSAYRANENRLRASADGNAAFQITGFTRPDVAVFDVTDPRSPIVVEAPVVRAADGTWAVAVVSADPSATYYAATSETFRVPNRLLADQPSTLIGDAKGAEYVVIAPAELMEPARRLAAYRSDLATMVVDLEDVFDEFSHGVATPDALRAFLAHAWKNWQQQPKYAVLAGDGSTDYRADSGIDENFVPVKRIATPHGLVPSDAWFGEVDASHLGPEVVIGRLPASSAAELGQMVDKVIAREAASGSAWTRKVVLAADNADRAGNFPADSDAMLAWTGPATERNYLSPANRVSQARPRLIASLNESGFVNYMGHGGYDLLADEGLLRTRDVVALSNGNHPVFTAMTCLAGDFAYPGYPGIGERLYRRPTSGAAAVWAATAMSSHRHARVLAYGFYQALAGGEATRLGDAVGGAISRYEAFGGPSFLTQGYALLGDPAMRLR